MTNFTVRRGRRYRATISLGLLESLAGNELIADRLRAAGFEKSVSRDGVQFVMPKRLWPNDDARAEMPYQVSSVTEIEVA